MIQNFAGWGRGGLAWVLVVVGHGGGHREWGGEPRGRRQYVAAVRLCGGLRDVLVGWGLVPLQLHLDLGLAAALHVVRGVHVHAPLALEVCGAVLGCCVDEVGGCCHAAVHHVCLQRLLVFAISRILIVVVVSSSRKTQPECGRGIPFPFDPPHAVVVVAVVVADVDLGRPGDTARAAVDLPTT